MIAAITRTTATLAVAALVVGGFVLYRQTQLPPDRPLSEPPSQGQGPTQGQTQSQGQPSPQTYQVASVHDGDTFRVTVATRVKPVTTDTQSVRLLGIDTPEIPPAASPSQCMGDQASGEAKGLLEHQQVTLLTDPEQGTGGDHHDPYGRWLRYAQTQDVPDIGAFLLHEGYARVYRQYPVARTPEYERIEADAKANGRGGWAPQPQGCGW